MAVTRQCGHKRECVTLKELPFLFVPCLWGAAGSPPWNHHHSVRFEWFEGLEGGWRGPVECWRSLETASNVRRYRMLCALFALCFLLLRLGLRSLPLPTLIRGCHLVARQVQKTCRFRDGQRFWHFVCSIQAGVWFARLGRLASAMTKRPANCLSSMPPRARSLT